MEIPGISANDSLSLEPQRGQKADRDAFMTLLVTQLENQDPLSPVQNEDFIAQLATFTSVEELEQLNDSMVAMIALNQSNALLSQMTQASELIGKNVTWTDPETGETGEGRVDSVSIQDGIAFLRVGELDVPLALVGEIREDGGMPDTTMEDAPEEGSESEATE